MFCGVKFICLYNTCDVHDVLYCLCVHCWLCVNVMDNYILIRNIFRYILLHGNLHLTVTSDSGVPWNFVRGEGVQQIQLRTERTRDLGAVAP